MPGSLRNEREAAREALDAGEAAYKFKSLIVIR